MHAALVAALHRAAQRPGRGAHGGRDAEEHTGSVGSDADLGVAGEEPGDRVGDDLAEMQLPRAEGAVGIDVMVEDHLVALAVGGSPRSPKNLWPEKYAGKFGARVKDKLERFLHDRVCDGTIRLAKARRAFRNWKTAYKRYDL